MSTTTDGAFLNLSVKKTSMLNDVIINGKLMVNPDKVYQHNFGVFESRIVDDFKYVLEIHPSGAYADLYVQNTLNPTLTTRITDKMRDDIQLSNMNFDHVLNDCYVYRFTSTKNKVLLTNIEKNSNLLLRKTST